MREPRARTGDVSAAPRPGATRARIQISHTESMVEAAIEDNGSGFDPNARARAAFPRFGLTTMRERAEAVGGLLEMDAASGRGTRIIARLPISSPQPELVSTGDA